ncbi:MAG: HAD family hydrolase [bacterium]
MATRKAVLFDLDGTLLDSNLSIRSTMNAVLAERGLPAFTRTELDGLIGTGLRDILARKLPAPDPTAIEAMARRYRDLYSEVGWVTVGIYPGLRELAVDLRANGTSLAVVTSKGQHETEALLADLGVLELFDAAVGDDDVRPIKPHPAPVLEACRRLGCAPADAAMIGDTRFDILAAKAAGAIAIGILWGNGSRDSLAEAGADHIVDSVPALRRVLRRL